MVLVLQIAREAVHLLLVQLEQFVLLSVAVVPQIVHGILPLLVAQDGIAVFPMRISVKHIGQKAGRGSFNGKLILEGGGVGRITRLYQLLLRLLFTYLN